MGKVMTMHEPFPFWSEINLGFFAKVLQTPECWSFTGDLSRCFHNIGNITPNINHTEIRSLYMLELYDNSCN